MGCTIKIHHFFYRPTIYYLKHRVLFCYLIGACDHVSGRCQCPTGFEGSRCDTPCRNGYYGPNCNFRCGCMNDAPCDAFTGGCRCLAGFTGPRCENQCPPLTAGPYCGLLCQCKNAGTCDPVTGYCECPAGFQGKYCERACEDGFFGASCGFKCSCPKCDPVHGDCLVTGSGYELWTKRTEPSALLQKKSFSLEFLSCDSPP